LRALIRRDGGIQVDEVAPPACAGAEDVRVTVDVAGLCRTDVYVAQGRLRVREPLILGHEFTGTVVEAGRSAKFAAGDRVTAIPLMACGACAGCRAGRACAQPLFLGLDLDGAFADQIVLPASNLRKVPPALERRHAAYTEPVAAALAVLNAPLPTDGFGVILGESRIALLTERILQHAGHRHVQRMSVEDAQALSSEADFVIETEATEQSLQAMIDMLRPGGIAVLKSRPAAPVPFDVAKAVKKDISIFAVSYASFDNAIDLISSGALELDDFLGETFALGDYEKAFAASDDGASVKIFFRINDD
jgi:L-iditol 2-dehydrogenase